MGIFTALQATATTLSVFERSLVTVQNNVANASTPGYAKQRQDLQALSFDPDVGVVGGVKTGTIISYRNEFAERAVRDSNQQFAKYDQLANDLAQVEPLFPVTNGAGVPAAINRFFQAVSNATVSPNDPSSRQLVLDRAREISTTFSQFSSSLGDLRSGVNGQIRETVIEVNQIAGQLADLNHQRGTAGGDTSLDAKTNQLLEQLAEKVNYQAVDQPDGTVALYAAGSLLLIGDQSYPLSLDASAGQTLVRDAQGVDITSRIDGGRLSGQLQSHNQTIPTLQAGLNGLARNFADQVNSVLSSGVDQGGTAPVTPLFTYDDAAPGISLQVSSLTPDQLALASASDPGGNGNAIALAALATSKDAAGKTFTQNYADLAASVGRQLTTNRDTADLRSQIYNQSKAIRQDLQGVSLNEEAAQLVQAQRAYQAAAQLFRTLNEITNAAINLGR